MYKVLASSGKRDCSSGEAGSMYKVLASAGKRDWSSTGTEDWYSENWSSKRTWSDDVSMSVETGGCYFYFRWRGWKRSGHQRMMRAKRKIYLYLD